MDWGRQPPPHPFFSNAVRAAMHAEQERIREQARRGGRWGHSRVPLQGWLLTAGGPPRDGDLQIAKGTTLVWGDGAWRLL